MKKELSAGTNDEQRTAADSIPSASLTQNGLLAEVRLSMEAILRDAVRRKATYQVQYADYDLNTWTAPVELTQNRMDKLLDDGSIRKVRLELEM